MNPISYLVGMLRLRGYLKHKPVLESPSGVVVVLKNGDELPVECAYEGVEDGLFAWRVTTPIPYERFSTLKIESLPPHSMVIVEGPLYVENQPDA